MATFDWEDVVVIPDTVTEEQKPWFVSFVTWYKKNYGTKLNPDNLCKVKPVNETEAIFLNFLKFFDKYIAQRVSFEELKIFHETHPMTIIPLGTDSEFRCLAKTFLHFGPAHFVNNSDLKGKTQSELQRMQEAKEWTTFYECGYSKAS